MRKRRCNEREYTNCAGSRAFQQHISKLPDLYHRCLLTSYLEIAMESDRL